ncbi:MAG: TonB-dependent receptor [Calditrichales bacterium]|nr:TonB-dependent receptor [Calditrichales bacterium]
MYSTYKVGADYNTGLFANNKMSFLTRLNYMTGNGWRQNTYYQGLSYYFGLSYFANEKHTLRLVLHGAPQYHAYSYFSESAKNFEKYGRDWNPHPYVADNDAGLTDREKDGTSLTDVLFMSAVDKDKGGEVIGNGNTSFDNNVYHKPQLELHHTWDINKTSYLQTNTFFSIGRGYGENVNAYYSIPRYDNGLMSMDSIVDAGTYQYRAYSIHNQAGLVTTYNTKWNEHEISAGAEARYWWARHYGLIINAFGNKADANLDMDNVSLRVGGESATFREGDIYYDYTGVKPNFSVFGHGLWKFGDLSIMTDIQLATRMYDIKEDFPSSNNRPVDDGTYVITQDGEGGNNDGFVNNADTAYTLIDYQKTYNFVSPKFGINYNIDKHINVFANYSRVYNEPRVKYFFNYGQPNEDLDIEIADDFELGLGYINAGFSLKLNLYQIEFQNKAYRIQDPAMANEPGYDYKGRRYVPVGDATYRGIEIGANIQLTKELDASLAVSSMENAWGDNLSAEAKDQLGIEEGDIEPGAPQFMTAGVLNYNRGPLYVSAAGRYYKDYYILPSNEAIGLYGYDTDTDTYAQNGNILPSWTTVDVIIGWKQNVGMFNLNASLHVNNLFDVEYWQIGNEYGVLPGTERNALFNLIIGF